MMERALNAIALVSVCVAVGCLVVPVAIAAETVGEFFLNMLFEILPYITRAE